FHATLPVVLHQVTSTISRYGMLAPGQRVIAAVSGGPDSMCLLYVLRELAPQLGFEIAGVAHFNHKQRGAESDEDERFVARAAAALALPFHTAAGDPAKGNLEQGLRQIRKAFFRDLIAAGAGDCVALGHTRDDQAETVLFRLMRGSGLAGLAGILPITAEGLIRPLLEIRREEVVAFLRQRGIAWREDSSNRSLRFARNRIRHALLPQLAADWNPDIVDTLARTADLAYQEEVWLAGEVAAHAKQLLSIQPGGIEIEVSQVQPLPAALARRLIRYAIRLVKGDLRGIEYAHVERVLELAGRPSGSGRCSLPGVRVERSLGFVWLQAAQADGPEPPRAISVPGSYEYGKAFIQFELSSAARDQDACVTLGLEDEAGALELRGWRPGDRYRPAGSSREQKLKDLFQKARVPSWRRVSWPILTVRDKILWAKDFGVAAEHAAVGKTGTSFRIRVAERDGGADARKTSI
ncbi:MAG: tRNA lysidine(34) synthetase TilS, partial [Acidobacteriota bacterium]